MSKWEQQEDLQRLVGLRLNSWHAVGPRELGKGQPVLEDSS